MGYATDVIRHNAQQTCRGRSPRPVRELLRTITDPNFDWSGRWRPEWREFTLACEELSVADGRLLLEAAAMPIINAPTVFLDPNSLLIMRAVAANPAPEYLPLLEDLVTRVPKRARLQLVRSLLEIAARANNAKAARLGLDALNGYVATGRLAPSPYDTPLSWLRLHPVHPAEVLPRLAILARHPALAHHVDEVVAAYAVAGHVVDPLGHASAC
jgi:hypothetical protein